jgi:hypothetical protein
MRLLLVLLLTGCTFDPTAIQVADDAGPHHITGYVAQPLRPLNCGTPYDFRICPLPVRAPIKVEPLPITKIIVEELGVADGVIPLSSAGEPADDERTWVEK